MKNMNIIELDALEMEEVNGGGELMDAWSILKEIDRNWDTIKRRFMNGWNSYHGQYVFI